MLNKISILSFFIFSCLFAIAQEKTPLKNEDDFLTKIKEKSKNTKSISSDFKEEKFLSYMKEPQLSEGLFFYQKEDKMRWEQQKPFSYIILMNNGTVRIQDNGKEKNLSNAGKMVDKINELMISMINGKIYQSELFSFEYFENKTEYFAVLTPKSKQLSKIYAQIELNFNKTNLSLNKIIFSDASGDKSIMSFFNEKTNIEIKSETFTKF